MYALLCTTALAIGTVGALIERSDVFREALSQRFGRTTPQDVFGQDSLNVLVLGCDEDLTPGGKRVTKALARSDMMLLAHLDFERGSITGVAIPRDTLLGMSGYRPRKINAYHAIGGPPLAKRAVEALLPG
ncbi:MAG: LCP family protein, partial [Fimbriimonas ginsengisoli]|nr:LCP family protein [Fimbriimonas ginsengisoli]